VTSDKSTHHAIRNTQYIIISALVFAAFALRVWNLAAQSVWWDEAFTTQVASHGWNNLWRLLLTGDRNPPLYFLSSFAWGGFAGWSEFSLRFLSVMYGVIGAVFVYKLTARLFGSSAGTWAMAAVAFAPALVVYSQEARMYALFLGIAAATIYCVLRSAYLDKSNTQSAVRNKWYPAFLLSESILLLTHYFAVPFVAALNLFIFVDLLHRKVPLNSYLKWIGGQVLAAMPLIIWTLIVAATPGSLIQASESRPAFSYFAWQSIALWLTGVRDIDLHLGVIVYGALALIVVTAVVAWIKYQRARLVVFFGIVAFLTAFALASVLTSFHPRYVLTFSLPLFVLIGAAISRTPNLKTAKRWRLAASGLILLVTIALLLIGWSIALDPQYAKDDARGVATYLRSNSRPDDVILIEANDYTLNYYDHGVAATKMITASTETDAFQQISSAVGGAKQVWLVHWNVSTQDRRGYWRFLLEQAGRMIEWTSYQGYELYEYELQSPIVQPLVIERAPVDFKVAQVGGWSDIAYQHEGALAVALDWRLATPVSISSAKVALRLIDAHGAEVSAVNVRLMDANGNPPANWPANETAINDYVLPIPPGSPPLTYTLSARLYDFGGESVEQVLGLVKLPRRAKMNDPYRTLDGYHWQAISATPASGLQLEAFSVSPQKPMPLDLVDVTLRWRKTGSIDDAAPRLRLVQNNRVWAELGSDLFERDYPIDQWLDGETVIEHRKLIYPPIAGEVQLQIGQGDQWANLVAMTLDTSHINLAAPSMQHSQSVSYNNFAKLLGYDLSIAPDRPVSLTLYWQALNTEPITTSYTVFTQLLAPDGHLVAQHDGPPQPIGKAWIANQVIIDRHELKVIDPEYRGPATLIVGWYNSATVERLKTSDGEDHIVLQPPVQIN
jgi:4-amino-4-deoxy-L-arabinose transferase-like glycosyltransferase